MNKRSAIFVATGLVVALVAGGFALSRGIVGPTPTAAAETAKTHKHRKPIVRKVKHTVKVHRKAKTNGGAAPGPVITVSGPSTPTYSTGSTGGSSYQGDDSYEHEGGSGSGSGGGSGGGDD